MYSNKESEPEVYVLWVNQPLPGQSRVTTTLHPTVVLLGLFKTAKPKESFSDHCPLHCSIVSFGVVSPQWRTTGTEIKIIFTVSPKLPKLVSLVS